METGGVRGRVSAFREYGRIGQNKYAGVFHEEYLRDLVGRNGVEIYKEMSDGDDVIGAMMFAIEMLVRQTAFEVEPAGKEDADQRAASFVKECMDDMQQTWQDTLSEILSFLVFGCTANHLV